jgi:hypothetical protein
LDVGLEFVVRDSNFLGTEICKVEVSAEVEELVIGANARNESDEECHCHRADDG